MLKVLAERGSRGRGTIIVDGQEAVLTSKAFEYFRAMALRYKIRTEQPPCKRPELAGYFTSEELEPESPQSVNTHFMVLKRELAAVNLGWMFQCDKAKEIIPETTRRKHKIHAAKGYWRVCYNGEIWIEDESGETTE